MIDRTPLLKAMEQNFNQGNNCTGCSGRCCTYERNSMRITRAEALDMYIYLKNNQLFNNELINRLKECIKKFRLDKEISTKKNHAFRRTYTCPFFLDDSKKCSIPPKFKPLGCLAYNPTKINSMGDMCSSQIELLEPPTLAAQSLHSDTMKWSIPEFLLILDHEQGLRDA